MNQLVFAKQTDATGRIPLIVARGLSGAVGVRDLHLEIPGGSFVVVVGPAASGKSSLVRLLSGLEAPRAGQLMVGDVRLHQLDEDERAQFRATNVSLVFPSHNLLPELTLQQNLELQLLLLRLPRTERKERALSALSMVGLEAVAGKRPAELAPLDVQRAAIARTLLNGANLIVADEPCRDLEPEHRERLLDLLAQLNSVFRKTIVLATRDESAVRRATLVHRLGITATHESCVRRIWGLCVLPSEALSA